MSSHLWLQRKCQEEYLSWFSLEQKVDHETDDDEVNGALASKESFWPINPH